MKKMTILAFALLCLLATACTQQEELGANTAAEGDAVKLSLSLPEVSMTPVTRAGEAQEQVRFIMEAWMWDEVAQSYNLKKLRMETAGSATTADFSFRLPEAGKYRILVWADYISACAADESGAYADRYYDTAEGLKTIKVVTDGYVLDANRDAFYGSVDVDSNVPGIIPLRLKRAVGKLVLAEKELQAYAKSASLKVKYTVPTGFNVEDGQADGAFTADCTKELPENPVKEGEYCLLCSDYLLAPGGDTAYTISDMSLHGMARQPAGSGTEPATVRKETPAAVLVKQNRRTVIVGTFMLVEAFEIKEPEEIEAAFAGQGTAEAPYEIGSLGDLVRLMQAVNSGEADPKTLGLSAYAEACYRQTAEIMVPENTTQEPKVCIGTAANPFRGVYDGAGMKISGMTGGEEKGMAAPAATVGMGDIALFGVVESATLKNIRLVANNQNKTAENTSAAGICAVAKGTTVIENSLCDISNITCSGVAVAAICAVAESGSLTIKGCKVKQFANSGVKGNDSRNEYIGGILGWVKAGAAASVIDSYNTAKIVQTPDEPDRMGGICGGNEGTLTLTNCYSTASFGYATKELDATSTQALSGYMVGGAADAISGVTFESCFYAKPSGAKAQAKNAYAGVKAMNDKNWPAWDMAATAWGNLGTYDAAAPAYPTLDWE